MICRKKGNNRNINKTLYSAIRQIKLESLSQVLFRHLCGVLGIVGGEG